MKLTNSLNLSFGIIIPPFVSPLLYHNKFSHPTSKYPIHYNQFKIFAYSNISQPISQP
nr:hypothetical protein GZ9D8_41 [uncultured archaeon GZfos9D8]